MDITTIKWDIWRAHEGKHWISDDDGDDDDDDDDDVSGM